MSRMTPGDVPRGPKPVAVIHGDEAGIADDDEFEMAEVAEMLEGLNKLREPFPPERIEKLPKPMWGGAWEGKRAASCNICHGRHVLDDAIHLDYVGHANTTDRLLNADPFWGWEPMALNADGLPLFDKVGGLWIRLTVCGVTRLGYGDGKTPKEIIGDAIRNAAMRFGVALDLWSKIDLHAERNPGDGPTPTQQRSEPARGRQDSGADVAGSGRSANTAPPRAANQNALDELLHVCDANGLDPRAVEARYNDTIGPPELVKASPDDIRNYAAILISECEPEPEAVDDGGSGEAAAADDAGAEAGPPMGDSGTPADDGGAGVGEVAPADPDAVVDTSDVEKQPGEAF